MSIYWDLLLKTEDITEELRRLYECGSSILELADYLGVSQTALRRKLHECGIKLRPRGGPHYKVERDQLPTNYRAMSIHQIAEATGYSIHYARKLKYSGGSDVKTRKPLPKKVKRADSPANGSVENNTPRK